MDPVTAKWFDDKSVTVTRAPELTDFMSDAGIVRITGAPRASTIHVYSDEHAIAFKVGNDIFDEPMYLYLFQNVNSTCTFYLKNAVFVLKEPFTNGGIGPRCVIREIMEAANWAKQQIPITHIDVSAIGDHASFSLEKNPLRGYYVWATMGFDARIPAGTLARLAPRYRHCKNISELVMTEHGREQWRMHGQSVELSFNLRANSTSWLQLARYMFYKGISA
ncbi:hypothetical protein [Massilia pseudoviolaceinigra]|uniref:hypothetical protein n=1 Tax=Massilia pseudoviolaceinigra TaxID=3057165 RepID=UPI0027969538|nr:hypothetical protein [Massilia sp. CCM 9206]MDQ1923966.1 hypothetical protein [Massilia sp. CCM 9206]